MHECVCRGHSCNFFQGQIRGETKNEDAFEVENTTVQRLIISLSLKSVEKSAVRTLVREIKGIKIDRDRRRDLETRSDLLEFLLMLNHTDVMMRGSQMRTNKLRRVCVCVCKSMCVALYMKTREKRCGKRRESRDLTEICISVLQVIRVRARSFDISIIAVANYSYPVGAQSIFL